MLGGMLGNNSCGSNSVVYGSTREHVIEVTGFLADGNKATFGPLTREEFTARSAAKDNRLETGLYRDIATLLGDEAHRRAIEETAPRPEIHRRNTGYALDRLMDCAVFRPGSTRPFNFCQLLAGSEGTLFFATEITVNCVPLPPTEAALVVAHFSTVDEALRGNLVALRHKPYASELIDHIILECTKSNLEQRKNRFFLQGDPGAILAVELRTDTATALAAACEALVADLRAANLGYAFPIVRGAEASRVWDLRRAGLGLLSNLPGDAKPVAVAEDTAVTPEDLPAYIREFDAMLAERHGLKSVHYAHAGSGEIHLRPILNLKDPADVRRFRAVAEDTAALVRKYRGSLSGEHGDGRLRAEFLRGMVGDEVFALFQRVKRAWDPHGIFNPGKIVDAPPMDTHLRYTPGQSTPSYATVFNFSGTDGMVRAEMCNGSGDCRKTHLMGGTMCPSFMATRDEQDTTRARANLLRHVLTEGGGNPEVFGRADLHQVLDLCLSCKGCKSECPSNVDLARLKAECLHQNHEVQGIPLRSRLVAAYPRLMRLAALAPSLHNALVRGLPGQWLKRAAGFHPARSLPPLPAQTLRAWFRSHQPSTRADRRGRVWLLADEFTNSVDATIGIKAVEVLEWLGYAVDLAPVDETGRAAISKGLLRKAARLAQRNVSALADRVSAEKPLIGVEPSALLTYRDEYPDLLRGAEAEVARSIGEHSQLFEEFIVRELDAGRITPAQFAPGERLIKLHGHCHQKALASLVPTVRMLELPAGHRVHLIPSGCCGMAGAFGYEAEHYELSMRIGELVLFPAVRALDAETIVAAPGTSCRHQILDGTGRHAVHPLEILHAALARTYLPRSRGERIGAQS
jgi:FAD/FMN-containing dehydrogenase/Fe-S oxidoreductase